MQLILIWFVFCISMVAKCMHIMHSMHICMQAQDITGGLSRQPPFTNPEDAKYLGTVITPADSDTSSPGNLPVLEW